LVDLCGMNVLHDGSFQHLYMSIVTLRSEFCPNDSTSFKPLPEARTTTHAKIGEIVTRVGLR